MGSVAIALEKKSAFLKSLPAGWRLDGSTNKVVCEDESFIVVCKDKNIECENSYVEILNPELLEAQREAFLSKPIFTTVTCQKSYSTGVRNERQDRSTSESKLYQMSYVVLINTAHPQIREQINEAFDKAAEFFEDRNMKLETKRFRVTINFSESIKIWFRTNVIVRGESTGSTLAWGAEIHLTYGVKEPTYFDKCFTCETCMYKCFWCACCLIFLLCFLPHWIYKKHIKGLNEFKISKPVHITHHEGPFQAGYLLKNLLYPPGTTFTTITRTTEINQQPYPGQQQPYPGQQQPYPGQQQQHPYSGQQQPYPGPQQPYPGQQQPYPGQQQPYPGQQQPYPDQHQQVITFQPYGQTQQGYQQMAPVTYQQQPQGSPRPPPALNNYPQVAQPPSYQQPNYQSFQQPLTQQTQDSVELNQIKMS